MPITKQAKIILGIEDVEVWNKRSEANIFFFPAIRFSFQLVCFLDQHHNVICHRSTLFLE